MKRLAVALILVGGILLVGSTYSFSSIEADRGTDVSVADNESSALLGVSTQDGVDVSGTETIMTIENNIDSQMTMTVTTDTNTGHVAVSQGKWEGGTFTVQGDTLDVECDVDQGNHQGSTTIIVDMNANAEGVTIEKTEEIPITYSCNPGSNNGPPPCSGPPQTRPPECN